MAKQNKKVHVFYDNSGDGAIYVNGKIKACGHGCEDLCNIYPFTDMLENMGYDFEETQVSDEWTAWIMDTYPNPSFKTSGYEWPDNIKDVETDINWEYPNE